VPLAQDARRRDCRFFRIAAERGFDRAPRDLRKRLSSYWPSDLFILVFIWVALPNPCLYSPAKQSTPK